MAIDFTFSAEVEQARAGIREFLHNTVKVRYDALSANTSARREDWSDLIKELRKESKAKGFWLPHMPQAVGGMGLGVTALAAVSAEAAKVPYGSYLLNAHAPDEGNMHTLHHFATEYQREHYLNPLLEGEIRFGPEQLNAGDYLYTAPGATHSAFSRTGCVMLFVVPEEIEIL